MGDLTKHYLISGRVQGVGFRMYVYRTAVELRLRGWVRNLADGRVEAWACGSEAAIKKFEDGLKSGPPRARVESITVSIRKAHVSAQDFAVKEDGDQPCVDES